MTTTIFKQDLIVQLLVTSAKKMSTVKVNVLEMTRS